MRVKARNAASRMVDSNAMRTCLALLRGINVGGKNILPMKTLAAMFTQSGCTNVLTYIQSGNVVFDAAPGLIDNIPALITLEIEKHFGMRIPVILRTPDEMSATTHHNPFAEPGADEKLLYVFFLADSPDARNVEKLDAVRSHPDAFRVNDREIYLHLPNGAGRTKLTNAYFDSKLATVSTARNWRTVKALTELMAERCRNREISRGSAAQ